jgi:hypothetical protein
MIMESMKGNIAWFLLQKVPDILFSTTHDSSHSEIKVMTFLKHGLAVTYGIVVEISIFLQQHHFLLVVTVATSSC